MRFKSCKNLGTTRLGQNLLVLIKEKRVEKEREKKERENKFGHDFSNPEAEPDQVLYS